MKERFLPSIACTEASLKNESLFSFAQYCIVTPLHKRRTCFYKTFAKA